MIPIQESVPLADAFVRGPLSHCFPNMSGLCAPLRPAASACKHGRRGPVFPSQFVDKYLKYLLSRLSAGTAPFCAPHPAPRHPAPSNTHTHTHTHNITCTTCTHTKCEQQAGPCTPPLPRVSGARSQIHGRPLSPPLFPMFPCPAPPLLPHPSYRACPQARPNALFHPRVPLPTPPLLPCLSSSMRPQNRIPCAPICPPHSSPPSPAQHRQASSLSLHCLAPRISLVPAHASPHLPSCCTQGSPLRVAPPVLAPAFLYFALPLPRRTFGLRAFLPPSFVLPTCGTLASKTHAFFRPPAWALGTTPPPPPKFPHKHNNPVPLCSLHAHLTTSRAVGTTFPALPSFPVFLFMDKKYEQTLPRASHTPSFPPCTAIAFHPTMLWHPCQQPHLQPPPLAIHATLSTSRPPPPRAPQTCVPIP